MPAGSTYSTIATYTVTGGTATSYTFTSIPQTYTDLVLVTSYAGYYASNDRSQLGLQVGNGSVDTGTNYSYTYMSGDGTTASSGRDGSASGITQTVLGTYPLGPSSSLQQNTSIIHFMNYSNTTTFKTLLQRTENVNSSNNTPSTKAQVNLWRSTSAINTIKIKDYSDLYYFHPGTNFTLYGIASA
jgi:hypothetical protein